ncbi:hypothetical protein ABPG75_005986 [Micractinium tetrahymenae]
MEALNSQLYTAALQGDRQRLQACLAGGADPNTLQYSEARDLGLWEREAPLHAAAAHGHVDCITALLAGGADIELLDSTVSRMRPLHAAAYRGQLGCLNALLAAGASATAVSGSTGNSALHLAASGGSPACVARLLAAGASPTAANDWGSTPAHLAAAHNRAAVLRVLLPAAPEVALIRTTSDLYQLHGASTPLGTALSQGLPQLDAARYLITEAALPPADEVLHLLASWPKMHPARPPSWPHRWLEGEYGAEALTLYAPFVARQPLTAEQWARVPAACPGLGAAQPAVLERSAAEAALLVQRLPAESRERLHTFALCLRRAQCCKPALPTSVVWRLLALAAANCC